MSDCRKCARFEECAADDDCRGDLRLDRLAKGQKEEIRMYEELIKKLRNYAAFTAIPPFSVDLSEAADAMEQLEAAVPRWIPVTERLPEKDGPVLTYYGFDHGSGFEKMFIQVLDYYATDPKPHFQHEGYANLKVTHWQPLPEPPKEETE